MNRNDLQSLALLALHRVPRRFHPKVLPLFAPPTLLHTEGQVLSHIYKEIFVERAYECLEPVAPGARILDAGAHVGLAALFFLDRYRQARVTSIEANPTTAALLRKNLRRHADRVTIVAKALTTHEGHASFFVTPSNLTNVNAGLMDREEVEATVAVEVECVDVARVIDGPFAFAKIDIEGAEYDVLMSERFSPALVGSMVVEFHDIDRRREAFDKVLDTLIDERGYRLADASGRPLAREALAGQRGSRVLRLLPPAPAR